MEGFTYARGTRGGKTGGGIMDTVQGDEDMCDLSSDDELDHPLLSDFPLPRPGSNRFVPATAPLPVQLPPHRNFIDRLKMTAGMEADYRNMLVKYARSWFWRPTRIYPFRRQGPSSLAYSMKEVADEVDLGHQKTIEYMRTQPLRIQLFKQLSKPRPQSRKRALPESDSEDEDDVEVDEGEEDQEMIVVKAPTRRSSGRTIRKPQKYVYPTPPATSDDEEEDTNTVPNDDEQDEPEESEDEDEEEEEEEEERKPAPKRRRTGHIEGIDRKTGKRTLVGTFLPRIDENGRFWCLDEECNRIIKQGNWTTKNGYKYHLRECCLQNPNSKRRSAMAAAAEKQEAEDGEELKRKVRGKAIEGMTQR
jgi:hypothetical protein